MTMQDIAPFAILVVLILILFTHILYVFQAAQKSADPLNETLLYPESF